MTIAQLQTGVSPAARRSRPRSRWAARVVWWPCATAVLGALAVASSGVRGADYPAQLLRGLVWDRSGLAVWNFYWYAGHPTASYSLVVPPLVGVFGAAAVGIVASLAATFLIGRVVLSVSRSWWAAAAMHYFAICSTVNVVVGRTTFAVGLALAAGSLLAWRTRRPVLAVALAAVVPLASPVAATIPSIVAGGVLLERWWRERAVVARPVVTAIAIAAVSTLPLAVMGLAYPDAGWFPFRGSWLVLSLVAMGAAAVTLRPTAVRAAIAIAAAASIVLFLVPNPLGGTFVRLTHFVVIPAAVVGLGTVRQRARRVAGAGAVAVTAVWSVMPGVVAALDWVDDPSVEEAYHRPLVDEVARRNTDGRPVGRLEIPFTNNHWEALYVASEVPFARGWERNVDRERNAELYADDLSAGEYRTWLEHNAVRWVAVPDVALDEGGEAEAELIGRGPTWLRLVWQNDDWTLYEVAGYHPIVDAPARLVEQRADALVIASPGPAVVELRFEYSPDLHVTAPGCLEPTADGLILARLPVAGTYELGAAVESILPGVASGDACP